MKDEKLNLHPWHTTTYGTNGLLISCSACGADMEETVGGHYPPLEYERDKYNRHCSSCLECYEGIYDVREY